MNYCNKCGKEIVNSGHVCNSEIFNTSSRVLNNITKQAIEEARSMTHDAVLGEVRTVILKLVKAMDEYYMVTDEGKELLERTSLLLDKLESISS